MNRKVTKTNDGSNTLYVPELDEHYHSVHGAVQEAKHVFIQMGLANQTSSELNLLEIGFGTGLNALLTLDFVASHELKVNYYGVEKYPVSYEEALLMNYPDTQLSQKWYADFEQMHNSDQHIALNGDFCFQKLICDFYDIDTDVKFDLVYFDAFGPRVQPDLWRKEMFETMYEFLNPGGRLVTYCAKGQVRRDMIACGFEVERLPGPPGKREMLRATK